MESASKAKQYTNQHTSSSIMLLRIILLRIRAKISVEREGLHSLGASKVGRVGACLLWPSLGHSQGVVDRKHQRSNTGVLKCHGQGRLVILNSRARTEKF